MKMEAVSNTTLNTISPCDLLRQVQKIEIKTKRLVDGLLHGAHISVFKGRGVEFTETREYNPGDDVRSIDWNVTARQNCPFVKEFIEERDTCVYIVFDVSASGDFGSNKPKKQAAIELAATLGFAAVRTNDFVSLALFSDSIEYFMPPKKGRKHVLGILSTLVSYNPQKRGTNLAGVLSGLNRRIKSRAVIFILSDFMCADFSRELNLLAKRHDVVAVNVLDPIEAELPDIGLVELEDFESGEQILVDTSDEDFRERYFAAFNKRQADVEKGFRRCGADYILLSSAEHHPGQLLRKVFYKRKHGR